MKEKNKEFELIKEGDLTFKLYSNEIVFAGHP